MPESNSLGVAVRVTELCTTDGFGVVTNATVGKALFTVSVYDQVPAVFAESRAVPETLYLPGSRLLEAVTAPKLETEMLPELVVLKVTPPVAPSNWICAVFAVL